MNISLDLLKSMAKIFGIVILYEELPSGQSGKANAETKTVTLDVSLKDNPRQHKCVMAEEIGHILFPPRPGHIRYHSRGFYDHENCSMVKHIVAQDERKALDWATGVLMPNVEFNRTMANGGYLISEIEEMFEVEDWVVQHKIGYYRRKENEAGRKVKWRDIIRRENKKDEDEPQ